MPVLFSKMPVRFWFLNAVLCALFYGLQSAYVKKMMERTHFILITWSMALYSVPVLGGVLLINGMPGLDPAFWGYFAVSLVINMITWPLFVLAIRHADLSLVMPFLAFTPVFILGVEWVLRGQVPSGVGVSGIMLVVGGAYTLNLGDIGGGVLEPIRQAFRNRGVVLMLIVSLLWSVSATVEYFTVKHAGPFFYPVLLNICLSGGFFLLLYRFMEHPVSVFLAERNWLWLMGVGGLTGGMVLFQMLAIQETELVNYVISIKRAGMVVSVLVGWLYFGEQNVLYRMIGAVLMITGVCLIRFQTGG